MKYSDIAVNICVSESTVRRIVQKYETSAKFQKINTLEQWHSEKLLNQPSYNELRVRKAWDMSL